MDDDLLQLLIYVAIGLVGVIASAYKNKMSKQQAANKPHVPGVPRNIPRGTAPNYGPELGPLMELFDIPKRVPEPYGYETIEGGPSIEEEGMSVDNKEASAELAGMSVDAPESLLEKQGASELDVFEEGQSDIQKMISKYEAIRKELDQNGMPDDIAMGEIVSVEAEEAARVLAGDVERFFDLRKAIIYSEILKRREY